MRRHTKAVEHDRPATEPPDEVAEAALDELDTLWVPVSEDVGGGLLSDPEAQT